MHLTIDIKNLHARLKQERERLNLSQEACAYRAGITRVSQSRYESGHSCPHLNYIVRLEEIGFDAHFLLFGHRVTNCILIESDALFGRAIAAVNRFVQAHAIHASPAFHARATQKVYGLFLKGREIAMPLSVAELLDENSELNP